MIRLEWRDGRFRRHQRWSWRRSPPSNFRSRIYPVAMSFCFLLHAIDEQDEVVPYAMALLPGDCLIAVVTDHAAAF